MVYNQFQDCIDACLECASICNQCAVNCLNDSDVSKLRRCIQLATDSADVCLIVSELLSRNSEFAENFSRLCTTTCDACAEECEKFASENEYCKLCADVCRYCADKCLATSLIAQ